QRPPATAHTDLSTPQGGAYRGWWFWSAIWYRLSAFAGCNLIFLPCGEPALRQQQTSQRAQVIQDTAAGGDMEIQLGKIVGDQQECLLAAVSAFALRRDNFRFHVAPGLVYGFREHRHVFVGPLDTVKRRFGLVAHKHAFPTSLPPSAALSKSGFNYSLIT